MSPRFVQGYCLLGFLVLAVLATIILMSRRRRRLRPRPLRVDLRG